MTDAFSSLIPDARSFLTDLSNNNNRDWFLAHKDRYGSDLKRPAQFLLDQTAADLKKLLGAEVKPKLFRANRDVRFSKDKTPYHLHLHMLWTADLGGPQPIGFFFGIGLDYLSVGSGMMGFDKDTLAAWRNTVSGPHGTEYAQLLKALSTSGFRIAEPELKRVPSPFDKDHPQGDLLKRKGLSAWQDFEADELNNPPAKLLATFDALKPLAIKLSELI